MLLHLLPTIALQGKYINAMTDDEFFLFCQENKQLRIERNHLGQIIIMSPTNSKTSLTNSKLNFLVNIWNHKDQKGLVFDSNGGFTLPDTSVFAPDVAWVSLEKWNSLTEEEKEKFAPICPEFIVELRSKTDVLKTLKEKMVRWIDNGVLLAWLIDPIQKKTHIYRQDGSIEIVNGLDQKLNGENVLEGFELDLSELFKDAERA